MAQQWKCTWWEHTGEYTKFDENGIASPLMRNIATGEIKTSRELPIGALRIISNDPRTGQPYPLTVYSRGSDGHAVICKMPSGVDWYIDGRANNCDMPNDTEHRCWVRHGTVGEDLHVDKNGHTCGAGAGSIAIKGWHGFLHRGYLTETPIP